MTRTQTILAGALVVQALGIFLVQGPLQSSTAPLERQPLLEGVADLEVVKVEVRGAEDDETVTLVRVDDTWTIEEANGYPAAGDKVEKLLDTLEEIQVRRPVVTNSRYHRSLKVTDDEYERHLRLYSDPDADPDVDLYLGSSPNYRTTHVRRASDDAVYEVSLGAYDVRDTPSGWITTRLLDVTFEDVAGMQVKNAHGTFELERMADGTWREASGRDVTLDKAEVDSLVRAASSITAAEPEGPIDRAAQGFESAAATVVLRVKVTDTAPVDDEGAAEEEGEGEEEGEAAVESEPTVREITLWVGSVTPGNDGQRFVAHSDFDFAARAWTGSLDRLVDATLSSLEQEDEE